MRLISQDGMIDVNYDNGALTVSFCMDDRSAVISYYDHSSQRGTKLAKYNSKDKALRVMEMLRKEYLATVYDYRTRPKVFKFPDDSEVDVWE